MRILLVEDNLDLCVSLANALESQGLVVDYAYDGLKGFELAKQNEYDVIILDINLPKLNGIELCKKIREELNLTTPVIMLTARMDLQDKLSSFENGADDYLVKPFEILELYARLQALAKRTGQQTKVLQVGDLLFDTRTLTITRGNTPIELNAYCRKILKILMQHSPEVVTRETLEYELWGEDLPDSDILKVHIHSLRQKIDKPFRKEYIKNIRGLGYQIKDS